MPRQDVPYGGALCRLKERIAEIWDELGKKLHSINGVEGDAAGDVKIVSGDAAVVITSDQVNHQIEVALDSSQLPAASVSSVNGQTGAVALDAGDIPSDGNSDVQTDIGVNKAAISACSSAITSEQLARQNADSTLQGNINTLSASIPTAAATAVANDPTVAQLATDVPNKVDKITSGSSLKAYTHTGATQGETSVEDGTGANTIGIRNANGRMQAADPASGATDKTLVTANWVSQTGNMAPNNLVHRTGAETKTGPFTIPDAILGYLSAGRFMYAGQYNQSYATKLGHMTKPTSTFALYMTMLIRDRRNGHICLWNPWVLRGSGGIASGGSNKIADDNSYTFGIVITMDSNDLITMWATIPRLDVNVLSIEFANNNVEASAHFTADDTSIQYPTLDPADYDVMVSV